LQVEKYIALLKNPLSISKKQTVLLQDVLEIFPYFQSARAIQLKGLKKQNSFLYNQALKKTAAFTTNRTVLFDFITTDYPYYDKQQNQANTDLLQINVVDSQIVNNEEQKAQLKETVKESLPLKKAEEILELGKPISFKKSDAFSFNQWLQLSSKNETSYKNQEEKSKNKNIIVSKQSNLPSKIEKKGIKNKQNKLDLIDSFLQNKPKIKPVKKEVIPDISRGSVKQNSNLMTETLARVYVEQKKYDKAIQAFRILSLKYPEKSSFFANQIKAVEFLKNN